MPSISLARIDDRLIHGQVIIKWLRAVPCDEILICDDQVRADPFLQKVLSLAVPPNVHLSVRSIAESVDYLSDGGPSPRVMLLLKTPHAALEILRRGICFAELNVGGMTSGPGTRRLYRSISATFAQIADLREIHRMGVRIVFQTVPEPEERALDFDLLLRKL